MGNSLKTRNQSCIELKVTTDQANPQEQLNHVEAKGESFFELMNPGNELTVGERSQFAIGEDNPQRNRRRNVAWFSSSPLFFFLL